MLTIQSLLVTMPLKEQQKDWLHFNDKCVYSCAPMRECILTCPDISSTCFGNRGQSSLTRLNTVYRKTCLKESLEAEKQTLGQMDSSHGNECSLERGTSKTISRKGKLRSSKRWLTPPKDSGAIKRHLHWGISVWTLVWEESSVCARITGIQLLLVLVRSFQLSGLHVSWSLNETLHRWCSISWLPCWSTTVWSPSVSQLFLSCSPVTWPKISLQQHLFQLFNHHCNLLLFVY